MPYHEGVPLDRRNMTSLFAPQFNYAGTYDLPGLHATPNKISLRLPDRGPKPTGEPSPAEEPVSPGSKATGNGISSAGAASSLGLSTGKQNSLDYKSMTNLPVGMKNNAMSNSMTASPTPATGASVNMSKFYDALPGSTPSDLPATKPLTVSPYVVRQPANPSWSQLGHDIATGWDKAVGFGSSLMPLPGVSGINKVTQHSVDPGITEPTNVFNPSSDSQAYTSPASAGTGRAGALDAAPYSSQFRGSGFGRDYIGRAQQASASNSGSLWNDVESAFKNPADLFADF
jgi:hypothetical protein